MKKKGGRIFLGFMVKEENRVLLNFKYSISSIR
jgi:hypothetical protein